MNVINKLGIILTTINIFSIPANSQKNYEVSYKHWFQRDTTKTLASTFISDGSLKGNNQKSIYSFYVGTGIPKDTVKFDYKNLKEFMDDVTAGKASGAQTVKIQSGIPFDKIGNQVYYDKQSDSIYSRIKMSSIYVLVAEKNQAINWKLVDEKKKIQGYSCTKATGEYRGRSYTAWFSPEIPIPEGPYKFKGLPGLILEIEDNRGELKIWAEKIQYPADVEIPSFMAYGKPVTFQSYLNYLGKEIDTLIDAALALEQNQPGYNISETKPFQKKKNSFCQIELTE